MFSVVADYRSADTLSAPFKRERRTAAVSPKKSELREKRIAHIARSVLTGAKRTGCPRSSAVFKQ